MRSTRPSKARVRTLPAIPDCRWYWWQLRDRSATTCHFIPNNPALPPPGPIRLQHGVECPGNAAVGRRASAVPDRGNAAMIVPPGPRGPAR
jgi:hypothetical protein